eukprot:1826696-Pyramimonas_sp.AAC.1
MRPHFVPRSSRSFSYHENFGTLSEMHPRSQIEGAEDPPRGRACVHQVQAWPDRQVTPRQPGAGAAAAGRGTSGPGAEAGR